MDVKGKDDIQYHMDQYRKEQKTKDRPECPGARSKLPEGKADIDCHRNYDQYAKYRLQTGKSDGFSGSFRRPVQVQYNGTKKENRCKNNSIYQKRQSRYVEQLVYKISWRQVVQIATQTVAVILVCGIVDAHKGRNELDDHKHIDRKYTEQSKGYQYVTGQHTEKDRCVVHYKKDQKVMQKSGAYGKKHRGIEKPESGQYNKAQQ